jgi:lipid-A-disaccharide synthase
LSKEILIIAGEASGDMHGALLVEELKKIDSGISITGIGGDKMRTAGMTLLFHIRSMSFLGFAEVIKHLPYIKKVRKSIVDYVIQNNIGTVVLIDYPGFNLSLAKALKELGVQVIYYISPQIWAWGSGRIKKIQKLIKKMLVIFRFEEEFYKKSDVNVEFVGHPLLDHLAKYSFVERDSFFEKFGLDKNKEILLLLSGSREQEVKEIFPECITAAAALAKEFDMQIVVGCSANIDERFFSSISSDVKFKVIKNFTYELMSYSKFGIIKSGTSTLEASLFKLPMVVVYKTNYLTYLIGRMLIKVKNIGLVNIVYGGTVVPEIIQNELNTEVLYRECKKFLSDSFLYKTTVDKLSGIKEKLGASGASEKAARSIYMLMNEA